MELEKLIKYEALFIYVSLLLINVTQYIIPFQRFYNDNRKLLSYRTHLNIAFVLFLKFFSLSSHNDVCYFII